MTALFHWFSMGGYAMYIWPAYGLLAVVLGLNLVLLKRTRINVHKKLIQWLNRSAQ